MEGLSIHYSEKSVRTLYHELTLGKCVMGISWLSCQFKNHLSDREIMNQMLSAHCIYRKFSLRSLSWFCMENTSNGHDNNFFFSIAIDPQPASMSTHYQCAPMLHRSKNNHQKLTIVFRRRLDGARHPHCLPDAHLELLTTVDDDGVDIFVFVFPWNDVREQLGIGCYN